MSFQLSGTVGKASDVKKTLEGQRDQRLQEGVVATDEVEQLSAAGIAAAEAAVRKLDGSGYQITVSGHHDPAGQRSISVSVLAIP